MKKSLALKLDPSSNSQPRKKKTLRIMDATSSSETKCHLKIEHSFQQKKLFESSNSSTPSTTNHTYRNKNISALPASLLTTLSSLISLDISHNKLPDNQIQLLMNSCTKLESLCIQSNLTTLIPASIWKLKNLVHFRHDWLKFHSKQTYEKEQNLKAIKLIVRKPEIVIKVDGVVGINFQIYCRHILKVTMDLDLMTKIQSSPCSHFAQHQMMEAIRTVMKANNQQIKVAKFDGKLSMLDYPACLTLCGFPVGDNSNRNKNDPKWKEIPLKRQAKGRKQFIEEKESETENSTSKIKIEGIREIVFDTEAESQGNLEKCEYQQQKLVYQEKGMPFHMLLSCFDANYRGAIEVDELLLSGYNPNIYDSNGLSPYHICVIYEQRKGLERLIEISFKNPGFFNLEMPSMKDGRTMLHFCVFLKNYEFTKNLIRFGISVEKRDSNGHRLVHLVDQNYEFLLLLRKLLKQRYRSIKAPSFLSYPQPLKKKYCRYMPKQPEQATYQIMESRNNNLLQMYQSAVGFGRKRI